MSPDKVAVITQAAATLYTEARRTRAEDDAPMYAVRLASRLYDLAVERVRASGPTSTEKKCKHGKGTICCDFDCPRHGHG